METIVKVNIAKFKNDIKVLAEGQKELRNQRKTVNISGERKMEPWRAAMDHMHNRATLRAMYSAYATLRGQSPAEIDKGSFETDWDESHHKTLVDQMLKTYTQPETEE